jgi:hypothetical protein
VHWDAASGGMTFHWVATYRCSQHWEAGTKIAPTIEGIPPRSSVDTKRFEDKVISVSLEPLLHIAPASFDPVQMRVSLRMLVKINASISQMKSPSFSSTCIGVSSTAVESAQPQHGYCYQGAIYGGRSGPRRRPVIVIVWWMSSLSSSTKFASKLDIPGRRLFTAANELCNF